MRLFSLLFVGSLIITTVSCQGQSPKLSVTREWWPDGTLRRESQYRGRIPEGEYRTWYENGHPYEIRHYVNGREEGLQHQEADRLWICKKVDRTKTQLSAN